MKMYDTPHTGLVLLGALLGPDLLDPVLAEVGLLLVVHEDGVGEPGLDHESAKQGLVGPDPVLVLLGALLGPDLLDPVLVEVGLLLVVPED